MLDTSFKGRTARAKRREMFWNSVTKFVGCTAVVVIVAVVMTVVIKFMLASPPVDEAYVRSVTGQEEATTRWSGKVEQEKSLFDKVSEQRKTTIAAVEEVVTASRNLANESLATEPSHISNHVEPPKAVSVSDGIMDVEAKRAKISQTIEAFFAAPSVEGKLPYVRDPERVKPLMTSYYNREPMPSYKWRGLNWIVSVAEPGYRLGYAQALFEDATPSSLVIEEMPNSQFRIDWEGFVRYGEVAWKDFLRLRPAEPKLLRVIASRPTSPPGLSSDATASPEWLELRHPAESGTVLGYFDKNDPKLESVMEQMKVGKWKDVPLTLRLCYPSPPTALNQPNVRIAGVEGKGWLILNGTGS
jgi:hypothetical protein